MRDVGTAASSKHPDNRMALIAASESANDAASVRTVLIVLGEIPPSKLLEIFHQKLICSPTDWSVRHHQVKTMKSAVEYLELDRNVGPTKVRNVDFRFIPKWLKTADKCDRRRQFRIVLAACRSCVRRNVRHAIEITGPRQPVGFFIPYGCVVFYGRGAVLPVINHWIQRHLKGYFCIAG